MDRWMKEFMGSITISDKEGVIVYLNDCAAEDLKKYGGRDLIGKNLKDCHSSKSNDKIQAMQESPKPNIYSVEKKGKKKFVCQVPWMENGEHKGIIELTMPMPHDMPNHIR